MELKVAAEEASEDGQHTRVDGYVRDHIGRLFSTLLDAYATTGPWSSLLLSYTISG